MNLIVLTEFGSHLYGINTPGSDKDYKGVFLPTKKQIFLNKVPKSQSFKTKVNAAEKNTANDIDQEIYSLHYFLELACQGQTVALDLLHAPDISIIQTSGIWKQIVAERHRFYTKNLNAFVGYCRRQASRYGIKGSRLNDAKRVLDYCSLFVLPKDYKLKDIWENLPTGEHIFKQSKDSNEIRMYEVCGRKVGETASIAYLKNVVQKFYDSYGERARQAANNENIDWKAVSHACRAAYQTKQILTENTITFPLKEAAFLKEIKSGKLDYNTIVAPTLEHLMDEVTILTKDSNLPEKVDREYWDNWLMHTIEQEIFSGK